VVLSGMRKGRPRFPHPRDLSLVKAVLINTVPTDSEIQEGWRYSVNNVPNYRLQGITNEIEWVVDVYAGSFFYAKISGRPEETFRSLPSLIFYLKRYLQC